MGYNHAMREVHNGHLWVGDAGDLRDAGVFEDRALRALVHLALEERLPPLSRELIVCHFPLMDGGNEIHVLSAALATTASFISNAIPTLVCCSGGMSRTPAVAAGAIAIVTGEDPQACLEPIVCDEPHDISPVLWDGVLTCIDRMRGE